MKEKNLIYAVEGDICEIECDIYDAAVQLCVTDGEAATVTYPNARNLSIGSTDGAIYISQKKRRPFSEKQAITISLPAHTVPAVKIGGRYCSLKLDGGIYGDFYFCADGGEVNLFNCAFENCKVTGAYTDVKLVESTVKNSVYAKLEKGSLLAENSFATRLECRIVHGNVGLVNMNCKDCILETGKGNVIAEMSGKKSEYNYTVYSKSGTVDKSEQLSGDAKYSVEASSGNGSVVLEFKTAEELPAELEAPAEEQTSQPEEKE